MGLHRFGHRGDVHIGSVLTVTGTLTQDRPLLNFYKKLKHCIGLEMEGSYYLQRISTARRLKLLRPEAGARCVYYVSDSPLGDEIEESGLAKHLTEVEGIPPLYAATRNVLFEVLK
eukprot:GFYU01016471.1.p1 GENE.GFYU01016471.1~~GFYU01016471.1.p1  ORF type:complete len:116 (-),score=5.03 GFYU01016471.1:20-367(-)